MTTTDDGDIYNLKPSDFYYVEKTGTAPEIPALRILQSGWICPQCGVVNNSLSAICVNSFFAQTGTSGHWVHI